MTPDPAAVALARQVHDVLLARGATLAVAESLTGGALAATVTAVPGVSGTFRGGVVAYATELKRDLLAVPADLLAFDELSDPIRGEPVDERHCLPSLFQSTCLADRMGLWKI